MAVLQGSNQFALRRAVMASIAIHAIVAAMVVLALRSRPEPSAAPRVDRSADVVVRMFEIDAIPAPLAMPPSAPEPREPPPAPPATEPAATGSAPRAKPMPRTLPAELAAIISRAATSQTIAGPSPSPAGSPIHGALRSGQSIVYLLDCSGSMGEYGKLARAQAALLATLRGQFEGVRVQIIAYNSRARPLLSTNGCVPATRANFERFASALAQLAPAGRSNHLEAVRLAVACRPDVVLLLTDAENLSREGFQPVLTRFGKSIRLCVAKVTSATVEPPQELR